MPVNNSPGNNHCMFIVFVYQREFHMSIAQSIAHIRPTLSSPSLSSPAISVNPPKCVIAVVLVDVDLSYWTSKVEHIFSFTANFSNICTAHAQKRLFMNFRCKFSHRRSIRRPRFPVRVQNIGDLATFSVDFCILYAECPPYFYFRFV